MRLLIATLLFGLLAGCASDPVVMRWDAAKEAFLNDGEANALLDRPMRAPWKL